MSPFWHSRRNDGAQKRHPPVGRLLSATVVGPDLATTDALATAVYADPDDVSWIGAFPGFELLLIGEDHVVRWTPGLDEAISLVPDPV